MNNSPPIQSSEQIRALLDDFVRDRHYVPREAQHLESAEELPLCLQAVAASCTPGAWRAWNLEQRIWFVVAQSACVRPERPLEIALKISFYDHDGSLVAAGIWSRATGSWVLQSVLDDAIVAVGNDTADRSQQLARVS